jgi:hypothetical protein
MYHYFVLDRLYESALLLNPVIEKYGFFFEAFELKEALQKFDGIITYRSGIKDDSTVLLKFMESPMGDLNVWSRRPLIFLRNKVKYERQNPSLPFLSAELRKKNYDFVNNLILTLRLYKVGRMELMTSFAYDIETKNWESGMDGKRKRSYEEEYIITEEDVSAISMLLKTPKEASPLTSLAFESFNLSYSVEDNKLRYVTLMTALESLFNFSTNQIAHTISRHLSILLSGTKEEFEEHYSRMKTLYKYRNFIVHGSGLKKSDLKKEILLLEDYVRKALRETMNIKMDKAELFKCLNSKGF